MHSNPFQFFDECFGRAKSLQLPQFDAMVLITATKKAKPSGRMVLLKGVVQDVGFRFFTNFESRKASELLENPQAQLLFYWPQFGRQIRVEGSITQVSDQISDEYWATRPRDSQIGGIASQQSRPLKSMDELREAVKRTEKLFEGKSVPRPKNWGGFELRAERFEFWEDGAYRLHERIIYERDGNSWKTHRLFP